VAIGRRDLQLKLCRGIQCRWWPAFASFNNEDMRTGPVSLTLGLSVQVPLLGLTAHPQNYLPFVLFRQNSEGLRLVDPLSAVKVTDCIGDKGMLTMMRLPPPCICSRQPSVIKNKPLYAHGKCTVGQSQKVQENTRYC
jgi:hypothetical protein